MANREVKYGIQISFAHAPDEIVAQAVRAEALGFESVWIGEHFFTPSRLDSKYPYTPHQPLQTREDCSDSMVVAGAIAASTRRLGITTAIYLLALRHPLVAARAAATLQRLAGGRLRLGVGAGWAREEFDALGVPFEERGSRVDESIAVLRKALAGGEFEHRGRHYGFDALTIVNQPVPLTVLIGGSSAPALRRVARSGDGWCATPDLSLEDCIAKRAHIEALRREYGRSELPFAWHVRLPAATREQVMRYAEAGFNNVTVAGGQLIKWTDPLPRKMAAMEQLAAALGVPPPA